ncbi:MAG: hypothetical protein U5Q16_15250 [Gammaproteobacteria bacterium]|nr:hypothetical protein [Gammaproteobacteria bacterium]
MAKMVCGFAVALLATLVTPSVMAEEEETVCERVTRVAKEDLTGTGATTAAAGLVAQAAQLHPYGRAIVYAGGVVAAFGQLTGAVGGAACELLAAEHEAEISAWEQAVGEALVSGGFGSPDDLIFYITGTIPQGYNPTNYIGPFNPWLNPMDPCGDGSGESFDCIIDAHHDKFGDAIKFASTMSSVFNESAFYWTPATTSLSYQPANNFYDFNGVPGGPLESSWGTFNP